MSKHITWSKRERSIAAVGACIVLAGIVAAAALPLQSKPTELDLILCGLEADMAESAMEIRQGNRLGQRENVLRRFQDNDHMYPMLELAYAMRQERTTAERNRAAIVFGQVWHSKCLEDGPIQASNTD